MTEIIEIRDPTNDSWIEMRGQLWPRLDPLKHQTELESLLAEPARFMAFLALSTEGKAIGFCRNCLAHGSRKWM